MSKSEKGRPRMATVVHGWPRCRPRMATVSSTDGHGVVHGWPHGRPRMATRSSTDGHRVVHGWPQGRPRMATRSSTDGHRVVHGWHTVVSGWPQGRLRMARGRLRMARTSKWQRGRPPPGCLRMTHRSSADGPTCARTGVAAPGRYQRPACCATTSADGRDSAGDLGGCTVAVHRQGCRHPFWR